MIRMTLALSFTLLMLSGCAAGKMVGIPPVITEDNFATIHIARPSGLAGCGVRTTLQINNRDFYWLACGEHIVFRVPAGDEVIVSQVTSMIPDDVFIDPKKGNTYYLENDCNGWACWLQRSSEARFNYLAQRCGEVKNVGY
jgi:hypothetical protein